MSNLAAFLHSDPCDYDALLPGDVEWLRINVASVVGIRRTIGPMRLSTFCRLASRLATAVGASVRQRLGELCARGGRVAFCADDAALALAVAYSRFWGQPIMPVRLVTENLAPLPGRFGRWFHNRACYVNIAASEDVLRRLRSHRDGHQRLLSVFGPTSDEEELFDVIRRTIAILGEMPDGDEQIRMAYVTHFYCNRKNLESVLELLRHYATYNASVLDHVHFVVVDDGSPIQYEIPDIDLNLTWLKIEQDIPWNQGGARNLGLVYAKADNVLLTDIDVAVPEHTLGYLARRRPCNKSIYRLSMREETTGARIDSHPNVFLLSRARYLKFFGYDEDFSGHYAFDDLRFIRGQKLHGTFLARLSPEYFVYHRSGIQTGESYHDLVRDESRNALLNARKHFEYEWYGREGGHSRKSLHFTWKLLVDRRRKHPLPAQDRTFRLTWHLRQLWPV